MRELLLLALLSPFYLLPAQAQTIVVGAEDDWYPYSGKVGGEAQGMAEDIVRAAFAASGVDVRFVSLPYARCVHMVRTGELEACFDTSRTRENEGDFLWPARPMFTSKALIYARADSLDHDLGPTALHGKHVAVTNGYEYGSDFDGDVTVTREVTNQTIYSFRMLALGRVQYALAFEKVARYLIDTHPQEFSGKVKVVGLSAETQLYCVFSRKFPDAATGLALFDRGFATIQANGTYRDILASWR
ncbi:polar amino acid transport system substrate-binding protein [Silvimonas terrae]|uniref:Polar amino acid transport system substrate-binding protein n=1 Tax=Silvimonas terrae TaxID=300266 RepID=A0A840RKQ7_9NEIS|nr:transporter substrate-binding domain-containing protein [Silvimonas terrae]MBB5192886.1 polar amino acid transport system substrate-binding protein [Silvimonas terrae]